MEQNKPKVGVAIIIRKNNKVLLGKRIGSHGNGTWHFPGGHLEFFESLENCAKREIEEEVGIQINNIKFLTITNDFFIKENKHYITVFMMSDYQDGKVETIEPDKCEGWEWFEWNNFPTPLFLPITNLLKQRMLLKSLFD